MTENKRRAVAYAYVFTVTARLGDVALFAMLISALRVEDMATVALASAVSAMFAIGVVFGADQVLIRGLSEGGLSPSTALRNVGVVWGYSAATSCALLGLLLVFWENAHAHALAIGIACTSQIVSLVTKSVQSLLRGRNNQTAANALLLVESAIRLVIISGLWLTTGELTSEAVLEGLLLSQVAVAGVSVKVATQAGVASMSPFEGIESREMPLGDLVRSCGYFFGIALVSVIQNRLDWLMISEFSSPIQLANYSIANRAYEILLMLIGIAATTSYPWLCRTAVGQRSDSLMLMKQLEVCVGVTLALACGPLVSEIISLFWPHKYLEAEQYIVWLLPAGALSAVVIVLYYEVVARSLERNALLIGLGVSIVHAVANWFFIRHFGAFGAIGGMVLLSVLCLASYATLIYRNQLWERRRLGRVLVYVALMVAFWLLSTKLNLSGWVHFLSLTVIGVSLGTMLLLDKCERHLIRESTLLTSFR